MWAYDQLQPPKKSGDAERRAFAWALAQARECDRDHEREYPRSNDFFDRDVLLQLARDNVRGWMPAYPGAEA